jgi:hypothetical protein
MTMTLRTQGRLTGYQLGHWGLAAGLLAAMALAQVILFRKPPRAGAYFQRVAAAAAATPANFDYWVSMEAPIPPAAVTMLHPNVTISRKYANLRTGQQGTVLLVQCTDARDLRGHYPPVCYVAHGFRLVASSPRNWNVAGLAIEGMVYSFSSVRPEELSSMIVYDFMILPDGRTCRDMDGVYSIARSPRKRQLGAAQLQVLVDPSMPEQQRDGLFLTVVQANRRTIDAIRAGDQ